jgi:hypothetical protein
MEDHGTTHMDVYGTDSVHGDEMDVDSADYVYEDSAGNGKTQIYA